MPVPILIIYLFIIIIFFWGGGRPKLSIMIATLKKNRIERPPPPHPPENKDELRKWHNMLFIWGRWGELMKTFCLFCQKTALHNLKTRKDVLRGVPLLDFYGIRLLLSGQTM